MLHWWQEETLKWNCLHDGWGAAGMHLYTSCLPSRGGLFKAVAVFVSPFLLALTILSKPSTLVSSVAGLRVLSLCPIWGELMCVHVSSGKAMQCYGTHSNISQTLSTC